MTALPDPDGVFRRYRPYVVLEGRAVPSLGTPDLGPGPVRFDGDRLTLPDGRTIVAPDGSFLLNYHGPRGTYRRYPVAKVISAFMQWQAGEEPSIPLSDFRDAHVIVGYAATGLYDLKPTPLS
ncbi:MAG: CHASE2 domain-containing protein, partial [Nitrospinae bacterium]|nr:CHASE2 domain-containing protein [Nitrospinota bacterium]